jgi:UDP-N-acetylglucosamine:LPS N-acetylglucosamine transferase
MKCISAKRIKLGVISLNSGGTAGHLSWIASLANKMSSINKSADLFVISDHDYQKIDSSYFKNVSFLKIPAMKHTKTIAGCLNYTNKTELIKLIDETRFDFLFFSTFFDIDVVQYARNKGIKVWLISYPLRDSHREAFLVRNYDAIFDKILTFKDIINPTTIFDNEIFVRPPNIEKKAAIHVSNSSKIRRILITCGGGGRPSSIKFLRLMKTILPRISKKHPEIKFLLIIGFCKKSFQINGIEIIPWSADFNNLLKTYDFVISEAGYFTISELLAFGKSALIIPGERRIDNQELRAVLFEKNKCGYFVFPEESSSFISKKLDIILSQGINRDISAHSALFKDINSYPSIVDIFITAVSQ